jgi:type I restriction enzyme M protein
LLLAVLSSTPVRNQIKAKRQTQDIIDSLGNRIYELVLPIPKQEEVRNRVSGMVEQAINERVEARELARRSCLEVVGIPVSQDEEKLADLRSPQV